MRAIIVPALAAGCLSLLALSGPARGQAAGQWRDGAHVYRQICGYCHETGVGPALWGRDLHPDYITARTRHGMNGMPAFRSTDIDDKALAQLAELIAHGTAPATVAKGGKP
jgi:mono/diheme cytochrome c family protein